MEKTTIEIFKDDLPTWKRWCKAKKMISCVLMNELIRTVKAKKQHEFYLSLPMPNGYKKPLSGVRIKKISLCNKDTYEKTIEK